MKTPSRVAQPSPASMYSKPCSIPRESASRKSAKLRGSGPRSGRWSRIGLQHRQSRCLLLKPVAAGGRSGGEHELTSRPCRRGMLKVICEESRAQKHETRLERRVTCRPEPGDVLIWRSDFPSKSGAESSRKPSLSATAELCRVCAAPFGRASSPRGDPCSSALVHKSVELLKCLRICKI